MFTAKELHLSYKSENLSQRGSNSERETVCKCESTLTNQEEKMKYFNKKKRAKNMEAIYKRKNIQIYSLRIKQQQTGGIQENDSGVREGFTRNR